MDQGKLKLRSTTRAGPFTSARDRPCTPYRQQASKCGNSSLTKRSRRLLRWIAPAASTWPPRRASTASANKFRTANPWRKHSCLARRDSSRRFFGSFAPPQKRVWSLELADARRSLRHTSYSYRSATRSEEDTSEL